MIKHEDINWKSVKLDNVHVWDYPDFCDAFICEGSRVDGTPLTEGEMEYASDSFGCEINELAHESLH